MRIINFHNQLQQTNTKYLKYRILLAVRANELRILVTRHNQLEFPTSTWSDYIQAAERYSTIPQNI